MDGSQPQSAPQPATQVSDSSPAAARHMQQQQQQQQQTAQQSLVVVSSSGSMPLVNSINSNSNSNAVVFSAQNAMSSTSTHLMTQAAGMAQNSIRSIPIPQQQLIMTPMNSLIYNSYLQGGHQVLTQGGNQYMIQLPALSANQNIFQLPPHSSNMTTVSNRRSTATNAQNIQPRPQSLLPAPLAQQVYRTNLPQQIIAQTSSVSTTQTNIQPRPQSSLPYPMIRTANIAPQLFTQQPFQPVFSPNQATGLCWAGQAGNNSGFTSQFQIVRSQSDPIQFLQTQTPLQIPFVQSNVQVPSTPAPLVSVAPAAVPATTQVTTCATTTPARFKPIATRPATSSSMGTQTAPRTTTTVADATKNSTARPKITAGPGRPVTVSAATSTKLPNGPVASVRDSESSPLRLSPASAKPPAIKSDVSSTNAPNISVPNSAEVVPKVDGKVSKAAAPPVSTTTASNTNNKKESSDNKADGRSQAVKRSFDKRDASIGHDSSSTNSSGPIKKSESPRLKNGIKSANECRKPEVEKKGPDILIHVIEEYVIEESSKPFPLNGSADLPLSENGSCRSDRVSNRSESPVDVATTPRARLSSDAGECQVCQKTGPKSRLKLKNGVRACAACFSKKSKLGTFNPVTSSLSEYDFPGNDIQPVAKEQPVPEPEPVVANDSRKKPRLSRKGAPAPPVLVPPHAEAAPDQEHGSIIQAADSQKSDGLFIPESGSDPYKWNVQDVYDFVRHLEGCEDHADEFKSQEIDGYALMLLKEDHLMSAMKMKLGPALRICSKIGDLRKESGGKAA